ncbi:hypothetical protein TMU3MR103_1371 [Tetragenococcus muriaticus 3MR10-3]|uniref:Uncharacterized protein n=1 Tax=Tetragenococcus muriaticus 3MR10-3 TaxID=1302648 RepID=A0A091C188_9ENTE|nr:hypothetical protein TMU3MR103_1371 [Tetragenococcus muriaticus 3MR10-3]
MINESVAHFGGFYLYQIRISVPLTIIVYKNCINTEEGSIVCLFFLLN